MSLQVFEDQENSGVLTRNGAKRFDTQGQKRTALGQLTNVRQQPTRAAKQTNQFKIYEDKENSSTTTVKPILQDGVKLKQRRAHISVPQEENEPLETTPAIESPMVLDESCMDINEEKALLDEDTDIFCLPEYQQDIHDYLREAELRCRPKPHYMRKQTDISPQMRMILVDWLVEVGEEYRLHDETLHLAINYIDRFLSQMSVLRGKLQLVGTACMFLASKFEEIYPPDAGEFVYITDDTYTKKQLLRMEHLVIKVLNFDIAMPTANIFIDLYCKQLHASDTLKFMAQYISELSLLDCENYLVYTPSTIAAASLYLAAHIVEAPSLSDIAKVTRYPQAEVATCVQRLLDTLRAAPEQPQQAIREKYKTDRKKGVSSIPIPELR